MSDVLIEGRFTALSHIHMGTGERKGNFHPTDVYVTAKALRGMLGTYLYHYDRDLFEKSGIGTEESILRFFPSYLSGSLPSPSNLKWCKACGGLIEKENGNCERVIETKNGTHICGNEGKRNSGIFLTKSLKDKVFQKPSVGKTIQAKVPIVRDTGTSPDKDYPLKPYNIEVFGKGRTFDFMMKCPQELADTMIEYLKEAGLLMGVGGFRSRGMGTILFETLNTMTVEEKRKEMMKELDGDELLMIVTSPVIVKDSGGYTVGFNTDILRKAGLQVRSVRANMSRYVKGYARGWDYSGGDYRLNETVPATAPGTSYFLSADNESAVDAELNGIGEQREIYGHVRFFGGVRIESQ